MLRLAALAAARRGGGRSVSISGLMARLEESTTTAATASTSSASSCAPLLHSVRAFAARAAPAEGGDDRKAATRNNVLVKALTPQPPPPLPQLSPAEALEATARAKEYSRAKVADHRRRQRDLSKKLQLKLAAVAALPEGPLRDAALEPDLAPFPTSRAVWTDTPPIPGFASGGGMGGGDAAKDDAAGRPVGAGRRRK